MFLSCVLELPFPCILSLLLVGIATSLSSLQRAMRVSTHVVSRVCYAMLLSPRVSCGVAIV
jgi:hypothetical protein